MCVCVGEVKFVCDFPRGTERNGTKKLNGG